MIDINDNKSLDILIKAMHSKDGGLVMKYVEQELDNEFSFDSINCSNEDRIVGEEFKIAMRVRKMIEKIKNVTLPKEEPTENQDF
jgi:hypothetical protein